MTKNILLSASLLTMMSAATVSADSLALGLITDYDTDGIGIVGEYHFDPTYRANAFSSGFAVAGRVDEDGDAWIGGGVAFTYDLSDQWYIGGSFMPGLYAEGDTDLGHVIEFRSLLEVGYNFTPERRVSLAFEHLSNGGIDDENPGAEAISLRVWHRF